MQWVTEELSPLSCLLGTPLWQEDAFLTGVLQQEQCIDEWSASAAGCGLLTSCGRSTVLSRFGSISDSPVCDCSSDPGSTAGPTLQVVTLCAAASGSTHTARVASTAARSSLCADAPTWACGAAPRAQSLSCCEQELAMVCLLVAMTVA